MTNGPPPSPSGTIVAPVVMCGGPGTRLWPASTPDRPKPFAPLVGERSGYQDALGRGLAVARGSPCLVVGAAANRVLIEAQAREMGAPVRLILEPAGRNSAAAMAAAAVEVSRLDRDAVMVVLSADHHVDDVDRFAARIAPAVEAARGGAIVALGVRPSGPSTTFGYIRPGEAPGEAKPVQAFVEKPDAERAARYVADGYLWNSGIFVVTARVLIGELERFAPEVVAKARAAVEQGQRQGDALLLGGDFLQAPSVSIDYAVMEKTALAQVVEADFGWADIGAWDAVWAASGRDALGNSAPPDAVLVQAHNVLVRSASELRVGVVGLSDLAVIAEPNGVLVCAMEDDQTVRTIAERMASAPLRPFADLAAARTWFDRWIRTSALPLWWTVGADHPGGGFQERLSLDGVPIPEPRRVLVQARQAQAYAVAGRLGWPGPWRDAMRHGLKAIETRSRRPDGLYSAYFDPADPSRVDEARTYDQAFVLLALATAREAGEAYASARAGALRDALSSRREPGGVYREIGEHSFQANANMHLFEAALAWTALDQEGWAAMADDLGAFALARFFDPERALMREFFDAAWSSASGETGRRIEPGHQFEWAFLLDRWAGLRGVETARAPARALFESGRLGVDPARGVAMNQIQDDFSIIDPGARLWPQTERLRTSLVFGADEEALEALGALWRYLQTPVVGLWRDKLSADGAFLEEPSPASSLYHLTGAWDALARGVVTRASPLPETDAPA